MNRREQIGDVFSPAAGAGAFHLDSYPINPGLSSTFPWLSAVADAYTHYKIHGLTLEFHTSLPTTSAGRVYMGFDYDVSANFN